MSAVKRHWICHGDVTDKGGVIQASLNVVNVRGRSLVFENDPVQCPACKTTGYVKIVTPWRGVRSPNQMRSAHEYDLCICKCNPPPKLLAGWAKNLDYSTFGIDEVAGNPVFAKSMQQQGLIQAGTFEHLLPQYDQIIILKDTTGKILANTPYKITMPDGEIIRGKTDTRGMTEKVYYSKAALLQIEIEYDNTNQHTDHTHNGYDASGCCGS